MRTRQDNGNLVISNGGRTGGRVVVIDLLKDSVEVTEGAGAYRFRNVGPDMICDVGAKLEGVTVMSTISNITAAWAAQVQAQFSNDGRTWTPFAAVLVTLNANGNVVSNEYTTLTDFGRHIRFQVGTTDGGAIERANLTLSVALRFYQGA
jgi:hypothetical protein